MDKYMTTEDKIREYRAQFEESMAAIAAYQKQAEVDMAELRASTKEIKELHKEIAAEQKKTDEQQKKTDEQLKKMGFKVSELNTNWGRFVESLVEGDLANLLNQRGVEVDGTFTNAKMSYQLGDGTCRKREFDIVATNGHEVVVVEVKTTLRPEDVDRFVDTMRDIALFFPKYAMNAVYGAVAYIGCESDADECAEEHGLFVIRATGDSASIVNAGDFEPEPFTKPHSRRPRVHLRAVPDG